MSELTEMEERVRDLAKLAHKNIQAARLVAANIRIINARITRLEELILEESNGESVETPLH